MENSIDKNLKQNAYEVFNIEEIKKRYQTLFKNHKATIPLTINKRNIVSMIYGPEVDAAKLALKVIEFRFEYLYELVLKKISNYTKDLWEAVFYDLKDLIKYEIEKDLFFESDKKIIFYNCFATTSKFLNKLKKITINDFLELEKRGYFAFNYDWYLNDNEKVSYQKKHIDLMIKEPAYYLCKPLINDLNNLDEKKRSNWTISEINLSPLL